MMMMTDDVMRDLVNKHDNDIGHLIISVEHLVASNTETNKRLEEISKYLAKQQVFSTKLEALDKDLTESFRRVHNRIDEIDTIQKSGNGCNSVRLLTKDVEALTKEMTRLVGVTEEHRLNIGSNKDKLNSYPATSTIKWIGGMLIFWSASFGIYTVQSLSGLTTEIAKISTLLAREMKDTQEITKRLK